MSFIHQPKPPSLCLWINHVIEVITTSHRFSLAADSHLADDSQPQSPLWQEIFKHDAAFLSFASLRLERASEVILLIEKSRLHSFLHPALIYLTSSSERKRLSLTVSFISRRSFFLFIYIYMYSAQRIEGELNICVVIFEACVLFCFPSWGSATMCEKLIAADFLF